MIAPRSAGPPGGRRGVLIFAVAAALFFASLLSGHQRARPALLLVEQAPEKSASAIFSRGISEMLPELQTSRSMTHPVARVQSFLDYLGPVVEKTVGELVPEATALAPSVEAEAVSVARGARGAAEGVKALDTAQGRQGLVEQMRSWTWKIAPELPVVAPHVKPATESLGKISMRGVQSAYSAVQHMQKEGGYV